MNKPSNEPKIKVIIVIGINEIGSFQPIKTAEGNKTMNDIRIPFKIGFIFKSTVAIRKPTTIHNINAEILSSQVSF